jgi:predicted restriction endonuclease
MITKNITKEELEEYPTVKLTTNVGQLKAIINLLGEQPSKMTTYSHIKDYLVTQLQYHYDEQERLEVLTDDWMVGLLTTQEYIELGGCMET